MLMSIAHISKRGYLFYVEKQIFDLSSLSALFLIFHTFFLQSSLYQVSFLRFEILIKIARDHTVIELSDLIGAAAEETLEAFA